jgi:hypothetical protein
MGRVPQECVTLPQRLTHKPKLSILKISQPPMYHARGSGAAPAAEVSAVDKQRSHALQCKFPKSTNAVDTATDDDGLNFRTCPKLGKHLFPRFGHKQLKPA